ncbi:hypothetical protein H0E87_014236, partial [Populus deltoides]
MEVGLTVALKEQGGTLKLSLLDCGCHVKEITIKLNGGASWLDRSLFFNEFTFAPFLDIFPAAISLLTFQNAF